MFIRGRGLIRDGVYLLGALNRENAARIFQKNIYCGQSCMFIYEIKKNLNGLDKKGGKSLELAHGIPY